MGTWGMRIYEDDTALDLRGEFLEHLNQGMAVSDIEAYIRETYIDEQEDNYLDDAWLALCCVELETGTLSDAVKAKVLEIIGSGRQKAYWTKEAGPEDAALRSRELTLVKKYIENYDGKPVRRKSWVELQKADKEYAEDTGLAVKPEKLDDIGWHIGDVDEKVDEDKGERYAGAHIACFVYWLITRDYFAVMEGGDDTAKDVKRVKSGALDPLSFLVKYTDGKLHNEDAKPAVRAFVTDYYTGRYMLFGNDFEEHILKGRDNYTFEPTSAEYEKLAKVIDGRLAEYKKQPRSASSNEGLLSDELFDTGFFGWYWILYAFTWLGAIWHDYLPSGRGGVSLTDYASQNVAWGIAFWLPFGITALLTWFKGKRRRKAMRRSLIFTGMAAVAYAYAVFFLFGGILADGSSFIEKATAVTHGLFFFVFVPGSLVALYRNYRQNRK